MASSGGFEVVDFSKEKNIPKKLRELVPGGLDVAIDCSESLFIVLFRPDFVVLGRHISCTKDVAAQRFEVAYARDRRARGCQRNDCLGEEDGSMWIDRCIRRLHQWFQHRGIDGKGCEVHR